MRAQIFARNECLIRKEEEPQLLGFNYRKEEKTEEREKYATKTNDIELQKVCMSQGIEKIRHFRKYLGIPEIPRHYRKCLGN